jgi:Na+-transporting NADH:ubiquinone oxidoreductase subunit C
MPNENKKSKYCEKFGPYCEKLKPYYEKFEVYRDKILVLKNDSLEKTIAIALSVCFVCAILVSFAAVALRPLQIANKALDMKKNILDVAGLLNEETDVDAAFAEKIVAKLVNIETGEYVEGMDVAQYDQRKAAKDPALNILIPAKQDIASIKKKAKIAKVYLVKQGEDIKSIILPVHGYGLWSTMYGFLALAADGQTVQSISFYDHAETPGLGGEIVNPNWRALWQGKKVYDDSGKSSLALIKGVVDSGKSGSEYKVDGLAGATLTSVGVSNMIRYWTSREGFSAYLDKVRKQS